MATFPTPAPLPTTDQGWYDLIEKWIANPPQNSRIITFTPTLSEWLLEKFNKGNRPKKPGHVARYAEDMSNGLWPLTGDTLKFSDKSLLRDGQNRLSASVMSGASFASHVVFGIPDEAFDLIDRGRNRDPGDVLAIAGYPNAKQVAAAIRWAEKLAGDAKDRASLEPHRALVLMRSTYDKGGIQDRVTEARAIYGTTKHPMGLVAGLLWHAQRSDPRKAALFARAWEARGIVRKNQAGRQLASMITALDKQASLANGRIHDTVRAAWAVLAWNGFKANRGMTVKSFSWVPTDDFPKID